MEEYHMDQVMMSVVGGDKSIVNDVAPEKQPYLTSLGVNILLWAGSKQVVKHLHRVMEGQTSSNRHKLFMNKQEREECCSQIAGIHPLLCLMRKALLMKYKS